MQVMKTLHSKVIAWVRPRRAKARPTAVAPVIETTPPKGTNDREFTSYSLIGW
jgi:hypothetical protein